MSEGDPADDDDDDEILSARSDAQVTGHIDLQQTRYVVRRLFGATLTQSSPLGFPSRSNYHFTISIATRSTVLCSLSTPAYAAIIWVSILLVVVTCYYFASALFPSLKPSHLLRLARGFSWVLRTLSNGVGSFLFRKAVSLLSPTPLKQLRPTAAARLEAHRANHLVSLYACGSRCYWRCHGSQRRKLFMQKGKHSLVLPDLNLPAYHRVRVREIP